MRLALLSDVHGNTIALDAVLADIERLGGVETYLVLGDHAAIGPDPVGALERISRLPGARRVRGNTDRYLVTGDRPTHFFGAEREEQRIEMRVAYANSFSWTLIAAAAERSDLIVLHDDSDYDLIAAVTGQRVEWVAPRGSL